MHVRHLAVAAAVVMVPRPAAAQITKTDLLKLRPDVPVAVADADARQLNSNTNDVARLVGRLNVSAAELRRFLLQEWKAYREKASQPLTHGAALGFLAGKGSVAVATTPPAAEILIDGEMYSNHAVIVAAGRHRVTARLPPGFMDGVQACEVVEGQQVKVTITLRPK